jgi:hypothetical protein
MQRSAVGLIALGLLTAAAVCYAFNVGGTGVASSFFRVGVVLSLVWLALPELLRVRGKFVWVLLVGAMGLLLLRPRLAPVIVVFCVIYAIVRSRWKLTK